ncbi:MAG: hypothetical protein JWO81_2011 [Alphaproteobacteria bacterium]|nr:hypothetical protein [Alphaproteobacteria bacterium]
MEGALEPATIDKLHREAFRLYSDPTGGGVTVRRIVKAAGVSSNNLYHWYGDIGTLYRLAVSAHISMLAGRLKWSPERDATPRAAILEFATLCAELFGSEDYRRLLYLVVRDGARHPWLARKHQSAIVEAAESALGEGISRIGRAGGARLEIRASSRRAFVMRLQGALALPMLVPGTRPKTRQDVRLLTESVASQALNDVYAAGAFVEALDRFPVTARPPVEAARRLRAASGALPARPDHP